MFITLAFIREENRKEGEVQLIGDWLKITAAVYKAELGLSMLTQKEHLRLVVE